MNQKHQFLGHKMRHQRGSCSVELLEQVEILVRPEKLLKLKIKRREAGLTDARNSINMSFMLSLFFLGHQAGCFGPYGSVINPRWHVLLLAWQLDDVFDQIHVVNQPGSTSSNSWIGQPLEGLHVMGPH